MWVLIWVVLAGGHNAPATGSAAFQNQKLCQAAASALMTSSYSNGRFVWASCYQTQ